jgi:hypothetical protein
MGDDWVSAATALAVARRFHGDAETAARAIVRRAAVGRVYARSRALSAVDARGPRSFHPDVSGYHRDFAALRGTYHLDSPFWWALHDCLENGAGPASIDWAMGDFAFDFRLRWQGSTIADGTRWMAAGVFFLRSGLELGVAAGQPARPFHPRPPLFPPDAHRRLPSDGDVRPGSLDSARRSLVELIAARSIATAR